MRMLKNLARALLKQLPKSTVVSVRSGPLKGYRWMMHAGVHTYWRGVYEPELALALQQVVKPGMTCFDCGANAGYFTLLLSKLTGPTGQVYAFEPVPINANYIRRHLELNAIKNVTLLEYALADTNGTVNFSGGGAQGQISADGNVSVSCRTIDSAGLPPPDLMKIDVEGAEVALVRGAQRTLQTSRPRVFMSLHIPEPAVIELGDQLTSMGYEVTLRTPSCDLVAIPKRPVVIGKGAQKCP
jgi:FkbM family methyltransferase